MVAKPPGKKGLEGLAKRFGLGAGSGITLIQF